MLREPRRRSNTCPNSSDNSSALEVTAAAKKILGSKLSLAAYGDVHSARMGEGGRGGVEIAWVLGSRLRG